MDRNPPESSMNPRLGPDDASYRGGRVTPSSEKPPLFIPRRFGIGYTLNFAHPAAGLCMIAGLILIVAIIALAVVLMLFVSH